MEESWKDEEEEEEEEEEGTAEEEEEAKRGGAFIYIWLHCRKLNSGPSGVQITLQPRTHLELTWFDIINRIKSFLKNIVVQ